MLRENYRSDYAGEFVVVTTAWTNGKKEQVREWVPNPVENHHMSGRAVVLGEGDIKIKPVYFETHKGGLLGKAKLQLYGVESVGDTIVTDFLIVMSTDNLKTQIESKRAEHTAIYTSTANCISNPGKCFMVPYNFKSSSIAVAAYLAAFDEHKEVFLVGAEPPIDPGSDEKYTSRLLMVFEAYPAVRFRIVSDLEYRIPKEWRSLRNVDIWPYRKFISECDIG